MELKQIKDLMSAMGRTGTTRLRIKKDDFELELEQQPSVNVVSGVEGAYPLYAPQAVPGKEFKAKPEIPPALHPPHEQEGFKVKEEGRFVKSPMVGTFYSSPGPDEPPFVRVGDVITEGTVVCIIEAMKVMNEVKSDVSGVVSEVLVESGHPVEFGTKLFKISTQ